jgi:pilus assembly protein CpaB
MHRNRLVMIGALALALAGLVSFATYRLLRLTLASARTATSSVVVAASDVSVGSLLQEENLRVVKLPDSVLPQGVFRSIAEVVGRGVLLPMTANEFVLTTKLAPEQGGGGLPSLIPSGMRAVSVKVNDVVSVGGFVGPGTHVDVLLTGNPTRDNDPSRVTTTTVLENVEVLAAGQKLQRTSQGEPQSVPVITLMVSPEDAQKLTLASSEGRIQLTLRNPLDRTQRKVAAVNQAALYVGGAPETVPPKKAAVRKQAKPIPPPTTVYVVEMIRGDKREETKF